MVTFRKAGNCSTMLLLTLKNCLNKNCFLDEKMSTKFTYTNGAVGQNMGGDGWG